MKYLHLIFCFLLTSIPLKSEPIKAFGELNFFESQESVEEKLKDQKQIQLKSHIYTIEPVFEDGKLVAVELRGKAGELSTYRDTVVKSQHDEMREILSSAYEKEIPLYKTVMGITPFEQVSPDIPEGYTKFTYLYEGKGRKTSLGITHRPGRLFNLNVEIKSIEYEKQKSDRETKDASSYY